MRWGSNHESPQTHRRRVIRADALKVIGKAFDDTWLEIAGNFGTDPLEIEAARLRLAEAVLTVAHEDSRDFER